MQLRGAERPTAVPVLTPLQEHPGSEMGPMPAAGHACPASRRVGAYLVSPFVHTLGNGWFATSVSICSASDPTDRVLRITRLFRCAKAATSYAYDEALNWISAPQRPLPA